MKKATRPEEQGSQSHGQITSPNPAELLRTAPTKIARVLVTLRHFEPLICFEAERKVGDHCLHSTISALANTYGLPFERVSEQVPNNWGTPCDVTRYALPACAFERADKVIAKMFRKVKKVDA